MRRRLLLLAPLTAMMWLTCFPELPDPGLVHNLRVLTIQADPATAMLDTYPIPTITVTALTVHPDDEELAGASHLWSLDIDDSVEGAEELKQIIPPEPHGSSIVLDLSAMFAKGEYFTAILPLRYKVEYDGDVREAVKLVSFMVPEYDPGDDDDDTGDDDSAGDDDDSAAGDDDDSAAGDDDDSGDDDDDSAAGDDDSAAGDDDSAAGDDDSAAEVPPPDGQDTADDDDSAADEDYPEGYNENPVMTSLTLVVGDTMTTFPEADLGIATPIDMGAVTPEDGLRLTVEVSDDKEVEDVGADLYWTGGCPGLWGEKSGYDMGMGGGAKTDEGTPGDECPDSEGYGFGGSAIVGDDKEGPAREFGWTPTDDTGATRLYLIVLDGEGGQTWQEIRVTD